MKTQFCDPRGSKIPRSERIRRPSKSLGCLLFGGGIVGTDQSGSLANSEIVRQADNAFRNRESVFRAAGGSKSDIVKVSSIGSTELRRNDTALSEFRGPATVYTAVTRRPELSVNCVESVRRTDIWGR
jgi:hypothetical protein